MAVFGADLYGRSKYGSKVLVDFGMDPFVAVPLNFSTVRLTWNRPGGNWSAFRLLRSRAGFAVTSHEDALVAEWGPSSIPLEYHDHDVSGGWIYYTGFLYNVDAERWDRVATASVQVPYDYGSRDKLWFGIPEIYRTIREDQAAGFSNALYDLNPAIYLTSQDAVPNTHLVRFLHVLGWGMDILRTQVDSILDGYDTAAMHYSRLEALAHQFGTELEQSVTAGNNRNLVKNLGLLYRKRGTMDGLREILALTTGLPVDVYVGDNLMLNNDESAFNHPEVMEWDPSVAYQAGDWVRRNDRYFEAAQFAYGADQAPPLTATDTAYWLHTVFPARTVELARPDTGDVGSWQVVGRPGETFVAAGVPDPTGDDGDATNALGFENTTASPGDFTLRTVPRYAASPTEHEPLLVYENGVPTPEIAHDYTAGERYLIGDVVMYRGAPFRALRTTEKDPYTEDWERLGVDERARLALSFYAHGPWTGVAGTGGALVYPEIAFYDEKGAVIEETALDPTLDATATYDPFNIGGGLVTGRAIEVGGKTWEVVEDQAAVEATNLATNPSMEASSGTVEVRRNLIPNGAFTNNLVGLNQYGAYSATSHITDDGVSGNGCLQIATPADGTGYIGVYTVEQPVTAGVVYPWTYSAKRVAGGGQFRAQVNWLNADYGSFASEVISNSSTEVGSEWLTRSGTLAAAPTGAVYARFYFYYISYVPGTDVIRLDDVALGTAEYFNGDTPAEGDYTYAWTGAAHASASIKTAPSLANSYGSSNSLAPYRSGVNPRFGSYAARVQATAAGNTSVFTTVMNVVPGKAYRIAASVKAPSGLDVRIDYAFERADGTRTEPYTLTAVQRSTGEYLDLNVTTVTAPIETTRVYVVVVALSAGAGEYIDVDGLLVTAEDEAEAYFDGDTPDTDEVTYVWTGTPHASTSQRLLRPTWGQSVADVVGGFVYPNTDQRTIAVTDTGLASGDVSVTLSQVGHRPLGVVFRYVDIDNFWFATQDRMYKVIGGLTEDPVSGPMTWPVFEHGDKMTVTLDGDTITVKRNGDTVATGTDAFNNTATRHGIIVDPVGTITVTRIATYEDLDTMVGTFADEDATFGTYGDMASYRVTVE